MIPIYRAKKIGSDEWVEGYLLPSLKRYDNKSFIVNDFTRFQGLTTDREVDPNTLAIHFPNMIDKNDKKIFASLSEDGVGGDRIKAIGIGFIYDGAILRFEKSYVHVNGDYMHDLEDIEVIGIHKGAES